MEQEAFGVANMLDQFQERLNAGVAYDPKRRPSAVQNLESRSGADGELYYAPSKHAEGSLRKCVGVRRLWIAGATEAMIDEAAELPALEVLFLERPFAEDFAALSVSASLRTLGIFQSKRMLTLESLTGLTKLRTLALRDLSRIHDLTPIGSLSDLEALAIDGPVEHKWTVDTLWPLGGLRGLQSLFMASLRVADGLLTPLKNSLALRILFCGRYFSTAQFRELKNALPELECPWFKELGKAGPLEE